MAKIPDPVQLAGNVPESQLSVFKGPENQIGAAMEGAGNAAQKLGGTLLDLGNEDDALDAAKANADFLSKKINLESDLANDQDYPTVQERYNKGITQIQQESGSLIRNQKLRDKFNMATGVDIARGQADIKKQAFVLEGNTNIAYTNSMGEQLINQAINSKDPVVKARAAEAYGALVDGLQAKNFRDPTQGVEMKKKWQEDYAKADAYKRGDQGDIDGTIKDLEESRTNAARMAPPVPPGVVAPVDPSAPASIRHNNPGAMWPGPSAQKFGAVGSETLKDGQGNKIATFPTPEAGGAAQFDLLGRSYKGMTVKSAIAKWSGGNNVDSYLGSLKQSGIDPNTVINDDTLHDASFMIPFAKGMAKHEAGKDFPMTDDQWNSAFALYQGGPSSAGASDLVAPTTQKASIDTATGKSVQVASNDPNMVPSMTDAGAAAPASDQAPRKPNIYDALSAKEREDLITHMRSLKDAAAVDQERKMRIEKQQAEIASDKRETDILQNVWSEKPTITAKDVVNDPTLTREAKERVTGIVNRDAAGEPPVQVSRQNAMNILADIRRPDNDPQKITDLSPIDQAYIKDGKLNRTDYQFLRKEVQDARTPEGSVLAKRKSDFLQGYKPMIDKSNPMMGVIDKSGPANFYNFSLDVEKKIDEYRAAKKNPYDLFDPSKPDFLGNPKVISGYQKPLTDSMQDFGASMTPAAGAGSALQQGSPPAADLAAQANEITGQQLITPKAEAAAPAATAPPVKVEMRKAGETIADYLKRTGRQ